MAEWNSLYLANVSPDTLVTLLTTWVQAQDYALYDAFGLIPSRAYAHTIRTFIGPQTGVWVRIVWEASQPPLLPLAAQALSHEGLCLMVSLSHKLTAYQAGELVPLEAALAPHLQTGLTISDLHRAMTAKSESSTPTSISSLIADELPPELRDKAQALNPKQTQGLFNKFTQQLFKAGEHTQAAALLQASAVDWNSGHGPQVRRVMGCLTISEWDTPDFVTLRTAYQLHLRRQRHPNAPLYPGDAESMAAVPSALSYRPVYAGKN